MGVARLCRCLAYGKSAEELLKRILCLDIIVRSEHIKKRGLPPAPRTKKHIFEWVLFQKRDEMGFIDNNGARRVEKVGKRCVRREKQAIVFLEHYLDAKLEMEEEHITHHRGFRFVDGV